MDFIGLNSMTVTMEFETKNLLSFKSLPGLFQGLYLY